MNPWQETLLPALDGLTTPIEVFFRDDDGGWNDAALRQLVELFEGVSTPLDVAVIPEALGEPLARWLSTRFGPGLGLHQHGRAHVNHELSGRKCEFGASRDTVLQQRDIDCGAHRLRRLLRLEPDAIFTPPWNRCTQDTARALIELGFGAVSRDMSNPPLALGKLYELPVTLDWMKYRCDRKPDVSELVKRMRCQFVEGGRIGIMLHHAVMSPDDFHTLEALLSVLALHPNARCLPMRTLARDAQSCLAA